MKSLVLSMVNMRLHTVLSSLFQTFFLRFKCVHFFPSSQSVFTLMVDVTLDVSLCGNEMLILSLMQTNDAGCERKL